MTDDDDLQGRIAVIGMAGRFPGARDLSTFWRNLRRGGRRTAEQNSMIRIGLWVMAAAGAFIALSILLALL